MRPRQELGTELRRMRQAAGLKQPDMARRLGLSQAKVSRLETGTYRPDVDVVRAWLDLVRPDDSDRQRLLALANAAQTDDVGWREFYRGSVTAGQRRLSRQDAVAWRIRNFEPFEIPGPFQDAGYARQVLLASRLGDDEDVDEAVAMRLERGRALRAPGAPEYRVVLTEAALRFRPTNVDRATHQDVLRELLAGAEAPNITVQVIPADAPITRIARSAFMLSDFPPETGEPTVVDIDLDVVDITMSRPDDIAQYERVWRRMTLAALDPDESRAFVAGLIERL